MSFYHSIRRADFGTGTLRSLWVSEEFPHPWFTLGVEFPPTRRTISIERNWLLTTRTLDFPYLHFFVTLHNHFPYALSVAASPDPIRHPQDLVYATGLPNINGAYSRRSFHVCLGSHDHLGVSPYVEDIHRFWNGAFTYSIRKPRFIQGIYNSRPYIQASRGPEIKTLSSFRFRPPKSRKPRPQP